MTKKDNNSTAPTTHHIQHLLPRLLKKIGESYKDRPDLVLAAWPEVIGPQFAPFTQALSFIEGVLTVRVKNSSLYALLHNYEQAHLLKNLRARFPGQLIKTIRFQLK